jgi:aryl-alcohol dehydrogenase-like predicted oxidoreductase
MKYRPFGRTGLQVSEIGFGAWAIGGNAYGNSYGTTDDAESLAALNRAYDLGCTFYDTADVYGYGHSETLIGKALRGWNREDVILATKVGGDFYHGVTRMNFRAEYVRFALEQSLRRLKTDYIDVYQLHNPPIEMIRDGSLYTVLQDLQRSGKIRFYGVSIFEPQEGVRAIDVGQVQSIQAVYNLFDRRPEAGLFDHCEESGVAFIAREPLANSFLTGKHQNLDNAQFEPGDIRANWPRRYLHARVDAARHFDALRPAVYPSLAAFAIGFVLAQDAVSVVIPGCKTVAQVEENMAASDLPRFSQEQLEAVDGLYAAMA